MASDLERPLVHGAAGLSVELQLVEGEVDDDETDDPGEEVLEPVRVRRDELHLLRRRDIDKRGRAVRSGEGEPVDAHGDPSESFVRRATVPDAVRGARVGVGTLRRIVAR